MNLEGTATERMKWRNRLDRLIFQYCGTRPDLKTGTVRTKKLNLPELLGGIEELGDLLRQAVEEDMGDTAAFDLWKGGINTMLRMYLKDEEIERTIERSEGAFVKVLVQKNQEAGRK